MTFSRKLRNILARNYLVVICNKSFTNLLKTKNGKVRQFAGRLEQKYKYLKEKFPDKYQTKDLKDRLFHGMHPHIHESMRFLYKKAEVTYEELLSETLEAEKRCCSSKSTSVKSKAAVVESEASPSLQKTNTGNKCSHHSSEICFYGDSQNEKHPIPKNKVNSIKGNGNKGSNANGNSPRKKQRASCISCRTVQTWPKAATML